MANDLYIVDNSTEKQTVKSYLDDWCKVSKQMDIATGYLEVGGLLTLDGSWQKLDKIRIILGDEVTSRTKNIIDEAVEEMKSSLDDEQEQDDFLEGVPAIIDAIKNKKIECHVYNEKKIPCKNIYYIFS